MQSGESHQQKGVGSQLWGIHDLLLQVVDLKLEVPDLRSGGIRPNLTPGHVQVVRCRIVVLYRTIVHFPVLNEKKTSRFAIRNKITAEKIRFTKMHELLQLSDRVGFG